jgi:hypothetical protein
MSYFTHYWEGKTCDEMFALGWEGKPLDHTAGKIFKRRGVAVGDKVYVVNIVKGILLLIGRMEVGQIVLSTQEASIILGYEAWEAPEHLIAKRGSATPMRWPRASSRT